VLDRYLVEIQRDWLSLPGELENLFRAYLVALFQYNGDMIPSDDNVRWMSATANDVVTGVEDGCLALAWDSDELVGFSLAVDITQPVDTRLGKVALGVGTYVCSSHRKNGVGTLLRAELTEELRRMGFDSYTGSVMEGNTPGEESVKDMRLHSRQYVLDLNKEK
jgi:GNAT superfamily N-acetyltransferase